VKIDIYQVNAFTNSTFSGNTSAVCPLEKQIDDSLMQHIAAETNLSKTAFIHKIEANLYEVRWFTPTTEISINDHAALASAYVIFNFLEKDLNEITLKSISSDIKITKNKNLFSLAFTYNMPELHRENNPIFSLSTGIEPLKVLKDKDYILVYENEEIIKNINPKIEVLKSLDLRGVCITAKGDDCDFVFRYFAPKLGVNEDLVTGSLCSQLTPYWSQVLNKKSLSAAQLLPSRKSDLICELDDEKIIIKGEATLFMKGEIIIEERKTPRDGEQQKSKLAVAV
jgi:PhzF family phenazine biosynthesis protein